ncbi:MAG TPA: sulfite exporter TauE/SafE family protein [Ktedonobacteraceae bacterium]|nr:sulfite exporter TauE/SafE family protein [Ktedonobacteraceae bacterium]
MTLVSILITFVAAVLGGTLNGVAGGGTFLTLPSLLYVGVPPIQANATSSAALWPGSAAAAWALRKELLRQNKKLLLVLGITSFIGGTSGALLLLVTSQSTFVHMIPYLLLLATILFTLSPLVSARIKRGLAERRKQAALVKVNAAGEVVEEVTMARETTGGPSLPALMGIAALQLVIAVYGGYFGGGIGILMLASLGMLGIEDLNEMNAVKNVLAACINGVAIITFIVAGAIVWLNALIMVAGAILGGYGGVYFARKLDQRIVRGFVIFVGCVMTIYFFFKYGFF